MPRIPSSTEIADTEEETKEGMSDVDEGIYDDLGRNNKESVAVKPANNDENLISQEFVDDRGEYKREEEGDVDTNWGEDDDGHANWEKEDNVNTNWGKEDGDGHTHWGEEDKDHTNSEEDVDGHTNYREDDDDTELSLGGGHNEERNVDGDYSRTEEEEEILAALDDLGKILKINCYIPPSILKLQKAHV